MKIKRRYVYIFCLILVVLGLFLFYRYQSTQVYSFHDHTFAYSSSREPPTFSTTLIEQNVSYNVYHVTFESRPLLDQSTTMYGLLFLPHESNVPGVVLLPGGGVKKESEAKVARIIAKEGFAVLTIDQRGIGETGGVYLDLERDYHVFQQGKEPVQHLSVYDALATFDVLRHVDTIDKNNIVMAGESMGGRYALIAGALDHRLKGVVAISSSGFHFTEDMPYADYLLSVDPDHYIANISPLPLAMIHGTNDTTIPLANAQQTFGFAQEPKRFFTVEGCGHGYCEKMHDALISSLKEMTGHNIYN